MMNAIETADLYRSAYLLIQGARVIDTRVTRNQVRFVIEGDEVAEHDQCYRLGQARVNPIALRETLNLLRDLLFERLKQQEPSPHGPHPHRRDRPAQSHR